MPPRPPGGLDQPLAAQVDQSQTGANSLFDLDRLERLILRVIAKEYFRLADQEEE